MTLSPLRTGRITGSRIPAILGLSPYDSRADILRQMVRQHHGAEPEFTGNRYTDWGNEHEPVAIRRYEDEHWCDVYSKGDEQQFVIHPEHDYLGVTPDGLVDDDGMVEAKCPLTGTWTRADERPDYVAQILLQLACTGRKWCDLVVYRDDEIHVTRVEHDAAWLPSVNSALLDFMDEYVEVISDPEKSAPHLEPLKDVRTDDEWRAAAVEWAEANLALTAAKDRMEKARQKLIALAPDKTATGCGVQVVHRKASKRTDWQRLAADGGLSPTDDYVSLTAPSIQVRKAS